MAEKVGREGGGGRGRSKKCALFTAATLTRTSDWSSQCTTPEVGDKESLAKASTVGVGEIGAGMGETGTVRNRADIRISKLASYSIRSRLEIITDRRVSESGKAPGCLWNWGWLKNGET